MKRRTLSLPSYLEGMFNKAIRVFLKVMPYFKLDFHLSCGAFCFFLLAVCKVM